MFAVASQLALEVADPLLTLCLEGIAGKTAEVVADDYQLHKSAGTDVSHSDLVMEVFLYLVSLGDFQLTLPASLRMWNRLSDRPEKRQLNCCRLTTRSAPPVRTQA